MTEYDSLDEFRGGDGTPAPERTAEAVEPNETPADKAKRQAQTQKLLQVAAAGRAKRLYPKDEAKQWAWVISFMQEVDSWLSLTGLELHLSGGGFGWLPGPMRTLVERWGAWLVVILCGMFIRVTPEQAAAAQAHVQQARQQLAAQAQAQARPAPTSAPPDAPVDLTDDEGSQDQ